MSQFFFNDTASTEIYTLSLHDALPISNIPRGVLASEHGRRVAAGVHQHHELSSQQVWASAGSSSRRGLSDLRLRSEEHTSELQSRQYLVCRLLLEKKKRISTPPTSRLV